MLINNFQFPTKNERISLEKHILFNETFDENKKSMWNEKRISLKSLLFDAAFGKSLCNHNWYVIESVVQKWMASKRDWTVNGRCKEKAVVLMYTCACYSLFHFKLIVDRFFFPFIFHKKNSDSLIYWQGDWLTKWRACLRVCAILKFRIHTSVIRYTHINIWVNLALFLNLI